MNPRHYLRLIIVTAAASLAVATVFAQNPATPPPAGAAPAQQARGQIPIPQPCTPEQIAAAQAAAAGQTPDAQAAGRGRGGGRGGGVPCHMPDKREGLTPGKYNAGQVAMNLKLVSSMHQPEGMYDPNATGRSLDYANSDLAFGLNGRLALQGNFHGLILYDVEDPARVKLQTIVACPGGQGDVSIWGHLAFMSVEGYGRLDCAPGRGGARGATPPAAGATPPAAGAANPAQAAPGRGAGGGRGTAPPTRTACTASGSSTSPIR